MHNPIVEGSTVSVARLLPKGAQRGWWRGSSSPRQHFPGCSESTWEGYLLYHLLTQMKNMFWRKGTTVVGSSVCFQYLSASLWNRTMISTCSVLINPELSAAHKEMSSYLQPESCVLVTKHHQHAPIVLPGYQTPELCASNRFACEKPLLIRNGFYPCKVSATSCNKHWIECKPVISHLVLNCKGQKSWIK